MQLAMSSRMHKRLLTIPFAAFGLLTACAVTSEDAVSSDGEELSCSVPSTTSSGNKYWKSQYDGSKCENENCGPTAVAMMRNALTCGASNHTAGYIRNELDNLKIIKNDSCHWTDGKEWTKILNATDSKGNWIDGTRKFTATEHCDTSYTIHDLAEDMSKGYVAVMSGSADAGQKAPCGFGDGHAIFVGHWNGSTFSVYDPDSHNDPGSGHPSNCGSTRTGHAATEWTKTQLKTWSEGAAPGHNHICAVIANGLNDY